MLLNLFRVNRSRIFSRNTQLVFNNNIRITSSDLPQCAIWTLGTRSQNGQTRKQTCENVQTRQKEEKQRTREMDNQFEERCDWKVLVVCASA